VEQKQTSKPKHFERNPGFMNNIFQFWYLSTLNEFELEFKFKLEVEIEVELKLGIKLKNKVNKKDWYLKDYCSSSTSSSPFPSSNSTFKDFYFYIFKFFLF